MKTEDVAREVAEYILDWVGRGMTKAEATSRISAAMAQARAEALEDAVETARRLGYDSKSMTAAILALKFKDKP